MDDVEGKLPVDPSYLRDYSFIRPSTGRSTSKTRRSRVQFIEKLLPILTLLLPQLIVVAGYIVLDCSKGLVIQWSYQGKPPVDRYSASELVSFKSALSVLIGLALTLKFHGSRGLRECFSANAIAELMPMALCFTISQLLSLESLRYFDPGSLKVLSQISLPLDAILSALVLSRRFSWQECQAIALVCVATIAFFELRLVLLSGADDLGSRRRSVAGLWILLPSLFTSSAGSVFAERFIKRNRVQLSIGSVISSMILALGKGLLSRGDTVSMDPGQSWWFHNWDFKTIVVLVDLTLVGWLAGLLVKRQSSVVKSLAQCLSSLLTFAWSMLTFYTPEDSTSVAGRFRALPHGTLALSLVALSVVQGVILYATAAKAAAVVAAPTPMAERSPPKEGREHPPV